MRARYASPIRAALIGALICFAAACSSDVSVPHDAESARLPSGSTLVVDFGYVNQSIGDSWYLVGGPDGSVLRDLDYEVESDAPEDETGNGGEMTWRFEALEPGKTTLRFQYCFRSGPSNCTGNNEPAPEPVELAVAVE